MHTPCSSADASLSAVQGRQASIHETTVSYPKQHRLSTHLQHSVNHFSNPLPTSHILPSCLLLFRKVHVGLWVSWVSAMLGHILAYILPAVNTHMI